MSEIQTLLLLLIAAAVLVRMADFARVPAPIVLVLGGLGLAFVPGLPEVALPPDAIFLVFLPPLLHAGGWSSSPHELRTLLRPLALLSIGLVFATAAVIAVVAHALVPDMSWAAAAVLGAVLAPTDPVAASATFARLGAPERVRLIVQGESLINDGSALVLYRIAVGVATGGAFSLADAGLELVVTAVGGTLVGLAVGWVSIAIIRRQADSQLSILVTVLTAYGAYILAEEVHVSGVLAAVASGLYSGHRAQRTWNADTRLTGIAFWRVMVFGLEITLFVLVGLQLPAIIDGLERSPNGLSDLLLPAAAIAVASIAVRMVAVLLMGRDVGESVNERFIVGWSGMRGAVSLAAALAVPLEVDERPEIIFLTFCLILVTIVGQGLTLPWLLRALGVRDTRRWSDEEAAARMEAAQAALDRLDELEDEGRADEQQLARLRDLYRARFRVCAAVLGGEEPGAAAREQRVADYSRLRQELIELERDTIGALHADRRLSNTTLRQIQRDLDLEDARVRS
jgi:CPA1 family monovalent cation:H+ antiporter